MQNEPDKFPGFPSEMRKNFWMYPRLMDRYIHLLSGSEAKVLTFVLRRTWGFQKHSDTMSVRQVASGGGKIGTGTGLSTRQVITALQGLERKGFITIKKRRGWTSEYTLVQEMHQGGHEAISGNQAIQEIHAHHTGAKPSGAIETEPIEEKTIEEAYNIYTRIVRAGVKVRMTREAKQNIRARLSEYKKWELYEAMENVRDDEFWNDLANKNSIAWFFASEERIAKFLALNTRG